MAHNAHHTKSHQVNRLVDLFGMTRSQATRVLEAVMTDIEDALNEGKEVRIPGVGTLYVKDIAERQRVNPQTRELFTMPAHKRVALRPSKAGAERLNSK